MGKEMIIVQKTKHSRTFRKASFLPEQQNVLVGSRTATFFFRISTLARPVKRKPWDQKTFSPFFPLAPQIPLLAAEKRTLPWR